MRTAETPDFYGYQIAKQLADVQDRRLLTAYGTLYRALAGSRKWACSRAAGKIRSVRRTKTGRAAASMRSPARVSPSRARARCRIEGGAAPAQAGGAGMTVWPRIVTGAVRLVDVL